MAKQQDELVRFLKTKVASLLEISPSEIGLKDSVFQLGIDSLKAVELKNEVDQHTGLCSSTSLIYDYPVIGDLAEFISRQLTEIDNMGRVETEGPLQSKCLSCSRGGCVNSLTETPDDKCR